MEDAGSVVEFWRKAGWEKWWNKDAEFDRAFRERFLALHERAAKGDLEIWALDAEGALALVILLDQFPRNAFRGTARMFATDGHALSIAKAALEAELDQEIEKDLRVFLYLPFEHSERLEDQERSVALQQDMGDVLKYAIVHRDVIKRFGRFPHRNPLLGRETTAEEQAFLDGGGFAG